MSASVLASTRARLAAFVAEIRRTRDAEFAYGHASDALDMLLKLLRDHEATLDSMFDDSDAAVIKQTAAIVLRDIQRYLPTVGFILRSTNVRNAFEVYGPLLRIATTLLGPETRFVLSSEWNYTPNTYGNLPALPGFVLLGLPAPESANPLLVPLAGHELGHPLWRKKGVGDRLKHQLTAQVFAELAKRPSDCQYFYPNVANELLNKTENLLTMEAIAGILSYAMRQCEESFCDFVALQLFDDAYLHAFAYLVAPNWSGPRPLNYPNLRRRANDMLAAAAQYGIAAEASYEDLFDDLATDGLSKEAIFYAEIADAVAISVVKKVISMAAEEVAKTGVSRCTDGGVASALTKLRQRVPIDGAASIADILKAGWRAHLDPAFWDARHATSRRTGDAGLKELLLKSIEVFEIEKLTGGTS
jgi:hypothetical protein